MPRSDRLAPGKKKAEAPAQSAPTKAAPVPQDGVPRLLRRYREAVVPAMVKEFGYDNVMKVPRLKKIVLNIGLGEALENQQALESGQKDLAAITGQHPVITKARKSIAAFKLRAGQSIGVMVTLRGSRMYEFYDRLVNATLPRIRDFRGVGRNGFDGSGNYSMGLTEQTIFPEIEYGQADKVRGFQITMVTSARTNEEALKLLELLGMPFTRQAG